MLANLWSTACRFGCIASSHDDAPYGGRGQCGCVRTCNNIVFLNKSLEFQALTVDSVNYDEVMSWNKNEFSKVAIGGDAGNAVSDTVADRDMVGCLFFFFFKYSANSILSNVAPSSCHILSSFTLSPVSPGSNSMVVWENTNNMVVSCHVLRFAACTSKYEAVQAMTWKRKTNKQEKW